MPSLGAQRGCATASWCISAFGLRWFVILGITQDSSSAMSLPPYDPSNETEIAYWNGAGGRNWVNRQEGQDTILAPILRAAIERAAVRPGERVVDVGCGTGATSIELGERVGLSGYVLGVDVSEPMLARAAERLPTDVPVEFVRADATTYRFESAAFDLLFSRFGVMFFAELAFCQSAHRAEAKRTPRLRLLAQVR